MAYEPTNWQTGDVVTAEKLNKLENGVVSGNSSGNLIATATKNDNNYYVLDKTWKDVKDAIDVGGVIMVKEPFPDGLQANIWYMIGTFSNPEVPVYVVVFRKPDEISSEVAFVVNDPNIPLIEEQKQ